MRAANGQAVRKRISAQPLHIANGDDVFAVGRGGEVEQGILAGAGPAVVIAVVEVRDGQTVGRELGAGRIELHLVYRGIDGMGFGSRVEEGGALASEAFEHAVVV